MKERKETRAGAARKQSEPRAQTRQTRDTDGNTPVARFLTRPRADTPVLPNPAATAPPPYWARDVRTRTPSSSMATTQLA